MQSKYILPSWLTKFKSKFTVAMKLPGAPNFFFFHSGKEYIA